jgi:membrane-bound lytic murein transglycosylase D
MELTNHNRVKLSVKFSQIKLSITIILLLFCHSLFAWPNAEGIQVYQKNVHMSPEHKQKLADDINTYRHAENLWDVLRDEFSLQHYEESYAVQAKIEWYMNNQDYLLRAASRAAPYLHYISQQVRKRHLPAELVLLPIVESGYNPFSVSNMGASGIWQLMPETASGLGVKRDWWYDGRRDVIASTSAALNYLAYLQSFFEGNWLLAIAAYNTGEGNVLAAIKRNIREGRDTDFWSLPVAQETRDYVPSILALAAIISHPNKYPVYLPPVRNAPYLAQVDIGIQINLKYAAMLAGISNKKLLQLNPGFKGPSTSMKGPYKIVIPIENVEQFTENLARSPLNQKNNWLHYRVKSGDTLASISKKFGTTTKDISKMNHLSKAKVHPGTNLLIPPSGAASVFDMNDDSSSPQELAMTATSTKIKRSIMKIASKLRKVEQSAPLASAAPSSGVYKLQPGDTIYVVRSKDTIKKIANRFKISDKSLSEANQLHSVKLRPGKQLLIPTHPVIIRRSAVDSSPTRLQSGDTLYMVRRGDTVEKIARKFRASASSIRITNFIDNSSLVVGDTIIIPSHMSA